MRRIKTILAGCALALGVATGQAHASQTPYLGQLSLIAGPYCPYGTSEANGQLIAISSNPALYSILGAVYGGDGVTSFALPDLRGRTAIGTSTSYARGTYLGTENVAMTISNLPSHNHTFNASTDIATENTATDGLLGEYSGPTNVYYSGSTAANLPLSPDTVGTTGNPFSATAGEPMYNLQPYLTMRWCIATTGTYPPHS